jgi:hypothetical protein
MILQNTSFSGLGVGNRVGKPNRQSTIFKTLSGGEKKHKGDT